ncbi:MAG TPA: hypothetical protein VL614_24570 [Acetobacteraceae bacterium]|jgi:hypothetical protein|nr:hypothetical protein [Acetobacteraceae bacterium]
MDKWLWTYASSTIWPFAVLLCASLFPQHEDVWCWVDDDVSHSVQDDDLAFYVAMITAAHI